MPLVPLQLGVAASATVPLLFMHGGGRDALSSPSSSASSSASAASSPAAGSAFSASNVIAADSDAAPAPTGGGGGGGAGGGMSSGATLWMEYLAGGTGDTGTIRPSRGPVWGGTPVRLSVGGGWTYSVGYQVGLW
jgi:hypothetical protein